MTPTPVQRELLDSVKRTLRVLVMLTVLLYAIVGVAVYRSYTTSRTVNDALCTFRGDLQSRVDTGRKFLRNNPKGFPGFTPRQIQQQIDNQERTIASLETLDC